MKEAQWLASDNPRDLLAHIQSRAGDRKLRLFGCACCRRWWPFLIEDWARQAIEVSEQFADGLVDESARAVAELAAREVNRKVTDQDHLPPAERQEVQFPPWWANEGSRPMHWAAIWCVMLPSAATSVVSCERQALDALAAGARAPGNVLFSPPKDTCDVIREVIGNPFRRVRIEPRWLTWGGGTVVRMARAIYEERRFEDLPVLADALEEAGCTARAILSHCRTPAAHVRGCWVVDGLLSRS
jgi:hypothetical protein